MKRILSLGLCAALTLSSTGAPCWAAITQGLGGATKTRTGANALPSSFSHPASGHLARPGGQSSLKPGLGSSLSLPVTPRLQSSIQADSPATVAADGGANGSVEPAAISVEPSARQAADLGSNQETRREQAALPAKTAEAPRPAAAAAPAAASDEARESDGIRTNGPAMKALRKTLRAVRRESEENGNNDMADFGLAEAGRPRVLLVGTMPSRPFTIEAAARAARELGVELVLLDKPGNREHTRAAVGDARYIEAEIDDHDEAKLPALVERVASSLKEPVDAVISFLDPYVELAGRLADRLGARGNPAAAVRSAQNKFRMREILAQDPETAVPSRIITGEDAARAAYRELGGGRFVMKPRRGAGSQLVEVGIDSEAKAAETFRKISAGLAGWKGNERGRLFGLDSANEIIIERQLEGAEIDVELVLQDGRLVFSLVSDNPPMTGAVENGVTFPSQLEGSAHEAAIRSAAKALRMLGLANGNFHVEMMVTPEGPKIIEVNPRMIGADGWSWIKDATGVDLIRKGLEAVLGLPTEAATARPDRVVEARIFNPMVSGELIRVEGEAEFLAAPGVLRLSMVKKAGDRVRAPPDDNFDYYGMASFRAESYDAAMDLALSALAKLKFTVRTADGSELTQTAAFGHQKSDPRAVLRRAAEAAGRGLAEGKKRVLLVGSLPARPFILERAAAAAAEFGVELAVLDDPSHREHSLRFVAEENVITGDIYSHDAGDMASLAEKAAEFAVRKPVDAVFVVMNTFTELAGFVTDRLGARGNPAAAVQAAHNKAAAREILSRDPELATPYRLVRSADEARAFYRELGGDFVLKPVTGAGSQLVEVDIDSEEKAARAFLKIQQGQKEFAKRPDAGFFTLDEDRGIMMERKLKGPEVDVELVVSGGKLIFSFVSDNPPMDGAVEKGDTYPTQMSAAMKAEFARRAHKAVSLLGLKDGNYHVEMMWTREGPKILEVNARMGGAYGWRSMMDLLGVDLVRAGLAAVLGREIAPLAEDAGKTLEVRNINPKVSGRIVAIEGLDALAALPGFRRIELFKKVGERIRGPEADADDPLGYLSFFGADYGEAMDRQLAALESIKIVIETDSGERIEQTAAWGHSKIATDELLASAGARDIGKSPAEEKLPRSYYWYLTGLGMEAVGTEMTAILLPIYAYFAEGPLFSALSLGVYLLSQIPGSYLGEKVVSKLDSRRAYQLAMGAWGLMFAAIPIASLLTGAVSPALVLAFAVVMGLGYGVMRGVAEHEITSRIVGQDNARLLEKAGSMFFLVAEPAAVAAGLALGALMPLIGMTPLFTVGATAILGHHLISGFAVAMLLGSILPFGMITYRQTLLKKEEPGKGGAKEKLSLREALPFVFFRSLHLLLYTILSFFFAEALFGNNGYNGMIVGWYSAGSLAFAALDIFLPKLAAWRRLPAPLRAAAERYLAVPATRWTTIGIGAALAFLLATMLVQSLPLTLGLAFALGVAATAAFIKWPAYYKKELKLEAQPAAFKKLSIASVLIALLPLFGMQAAHLAGWGTAIVPLLWVIVVAISIGGLALAAVLRPSAGEAGASTP